MTCVTRDPLSRALVVQPFEVSGRLVFVTNTPRPAKLDLAI